MTSSTPTMLDAMRNGLKSPEVTDPLLRTIVDAVSAREASLRPSRAIAALEREAQRKAQQAADFVLFCAELSVVVTPDEAARLVELLPYDLFIRLSVWGDARRWAAMTETPPSPDARIPDLTPWRLDIESRLAALERTPDSKARAIGADSGASR